MQVVIMHRSVFESLMRTLKGHLLYQAEYLSRLLVKPPSTRSEAEVLKLASYLTSLPRFQEVPQEQLVQVAKEVTYVELTAGATVCKQGVSPYRAHCIGPSMQHMHILQCKAPCAPTSAGAYILSLIACNQCGQYKVWCIQQSSELRLYCTASQQLLHVQADKQKVGLFILPLTSSTWL